MYLPAHGLLASDDSLTQMAKDEVLDYAKTAHAMGKPHDTWSLATPVNDPKGSSGMFIVRTIEAQRLDKTILYTPTLPEVLAYIHQHGPLFLNTSNETSA